jgi:FG-GAP-like repeat
MGVARARLGSWLATLVLVGVATTTLSAVSPVAASAAVTFAPAAGSPFATTDPPLTPFVGFPLLGNAALGDFNRDGRSDLAVLDKDLSVSVMLGDTAGGLTLAPGTPAPVRSGANFFGGEMLATADFNGDGKLDLAITDPQQKQLFVLLGDGAGGFHATGSMLSIPGALEAPIVTGDFNGDGKQDVAVIDNGLIVLFGNGAGGFAPAPGSPLTLPGYPESAAVGDFNGDGRADLAMAIGNGVSIFLGSDKGAPVLASEAPLGRQASSHGIVTADLNGDGKLDLALASEWEGVVSVLLGDGHGGFSAAAGSPFTVPSGGPAMGLPDSIAVGDFDCDGKPDLAVTNFNGSSDNVAILRGDGTGAFSAEAELFPANGNPGPVLAGDFAGNGTLGLAIVNPYQGRITLLDDTSCPLPPQPSPPGGWPRGPGGGSHGGSTGAGNLPPIRGRLLALLRDQLLPAARRARIVSLLKHDRLSERFAMPEAGRAEIDWYVSGGAPGRAVRSHDARTLIASGKLSFFTAGAKTMRIALTRAGRQMVHRGFRRSVTVGGSFTPNGATPLTAQLTFALAVRPGAQWARP